MATVEPDRKKKQHRSPAYPSMGLKTALDYATTVYKQEKRTAAPVAVVASHCGTDIKSSKGLRLIAALKQYGLAVEEGSGEDRQVRLSETALDYLIGDSDGQKSEAVQTAALSPPIHKKIWGHFKGELPSDASLKAFLLRQLDFNDKYVDRFIKQFRSTLRFAGLEEGDTIDEPDAEEENGNGQEEQNRSPDLLSPNTFKDFTPKPGGGAKMRELPITLPSLNIAVLKIPTPMSELDFTTLVNSLAAWKDALVAKQKPPKPTDGDDDLDVECDE